MATAVVTSPELRTFQASVSPLSPLADDDDDFEFRLPAAGAALSAADELFSGGKLVPLQPLPPPSPSPSPPTAQEPASEPASPRAPRCTGRWRDLLLLVSKKPSNAATKDRTGGSLKRQETPAQPLLSRASSSSSSTSSSDSGKNARRPPSPSRSPLRSRAAPVANLLHLVSKKSTGDKNGAEVSLRRQEPWVHPLLSRASSSSSTSSSDSGKIARAMQLSQPRPPSRVRPTVAAESPRVSASGRVVFRGLERSSSSPATAGLGALRPRPRGMERSYSANVRVDPVINVFGFGHLFFPASPAKERKTEKERDSAGTGAGRRSGPEKLAVVLRDPLD